MANITLMGANYQGVPAVNLPKTGGGLADFYEYNFMGKMAYPMGKQYDTGAVPLSQTGFDTWTPSTTAAIIKASETYSFIADFTKYEYLLKWETTFKPVLIEGATTKAQIIYEAADQYQFINKRPSTIANIQADNFNGNLCSTYFTTPFLRYYNTSGTNTFTYSISYGIYPSIVGATFSNSTSNTPTITAKSPNIYARCYAAYFATDRAAELDKDLSTVQVVGRLYRIEKQGAVASMYKDFLDRIRGDL